MINEHKIDVVSTNYSKMMNLSTAHISEETAIWLQEGNHPSLIFYTKSVYGFWIMVPPEQEDWGNISDVPDELRTILHYANEHCCAWFMLDYDYDQVDGLPTFDW